MNIDFPFHYDHRGRTAETDHAGHVRDLIEQFLFTSPGERINRPEFGSGLLSMVFEPHGPELGAALQEIIRAGLQRWLDDLIEVQHLEVTSEDAKLKVEVRYVLRQTGEAGEATFERSTVP